MWLAGGCDKQRLAGVAAFFGWPRQVLILVFSRITQVKIPITTL
jgi:hypothetical protein